MTHMVCPCLNVQLFCVKGQQCHQEDINSDTTSHDPFFSQPLTRVVLDKKGIVIAQSNLLGIRTAGPWTLSTCLSCKRDTHAMCTDQEKILVNTQALLSDASLIKNLLLSANYSQLYQLILPQLPDNPISPTTDNGSPVKSCQLKTIIQSVRQQAANFLFQEQKQMDERVKAYTDKQYTLYATLQTKVTRERQSLIELVNRSFLQQQQQRGGIKMVLPSPFDHFPSPPTSPDHSGSTSSSDLTFERHEVSLPKAVVRLSRKVPTSRRIPTQGSRDLPANRNGYQRSKSVDAGTIFDMDGLDDEEESAAFPISDDEEDTDDSTTEEAQLQITNLHKYASSVPITVPFLTTFNHQSNRQENPTPDDPSQIAASIQALALSMREDKEMFGDLPRRRLNTGELVKSRPF